MANNNRLVGLRRKQDFEDLRFDGRAVTPTRWLLVSYRQNEEKQCRFGWTIGRKVGNAVLRNRIKRWCREYFRTVQSTTKANVDVNVVIRPGNQDLVRNLTHEKFIESLGRAWDSIQKNI